MRLVLLPRPWDSGADYEFPALILSQEPILAVLHAGVHWSVHVGATRLAVVHS